MSSPYASVLLDMGFSVEKVNRALEVTGNQGVEPAMEWLLAHGDELDMSVSPVKDAASTIAVAGSTQDVSDQSEASVPSTSAATAPNETPKSIKCEDCNKLFSTQLEVTYHASKSGHSNFSESTEEKKPLTEEQKKEQLRLIEQKLKEKKKEREEKEKAEALEREKSRIKSGKEIIAIKKKMEDEELKKAVEQRRREKEEDRMARQKIKDQIEADKAARRAKAAEAAGNVAKTPAPAPTPVKSAPTKDYTETRIQIRLTDGQSLTQTFGVKEQLSAVRLYIELNRKDDDGPFSLMTSFPKKIFQEEDFEKPLEALGLVPSAVVIVSKTNLTI